MARKKKERDESRSGAPPGGARFPSSVVALGAAAIAAVAALAVVGVLAFPGGSDDNPEDGQLRAVIVDQLELTQPNPDFVSNVRGILAQAGYAVDYIPGEAVTVEFYRTLPQKDYDLVLMRVHAGITTEVDQATGERTGTEYVSLFTGEPYDETKYPQEQINRLGKARYNEDSEPLFGIGPEFVEHSMEGDFGDALVVMMGCDGLRSQRTAEAFLDRGASAFVSWTKPVSAPHTDTATEKLLRKLFQDNLPVEEAVQSTASEVGADPAYEGELRVLS